MWLDLEDISRFPHVAVPISDLKPDLKIDPIGGVSLLSIAQKLTRLENPSDYYPQIKLSVFDQLKTDELFMNGGSHLYDESTADNQTSTSEDNPASRLCRESTDGEGSEASDIQSCVRVALVTGGASKIGAYITRKLHSSGFNVAIHYCTGERAARDLAAVLNEVRQGSVITVQADFSVAPQETSRKVVVKVVGRWAGAGWMCWLIMLPSSCRLSWAKSMKRY
jgi:hypothetical protein